MWGRLPAALFAIWLGTSACATHGSTARPASPAAFAAEPGWVHVADVELTRQRAAKDCGAAALSTVLGHWYRQNREPGTSARPPEELERGYIDRALRNQHELRESHRPRKTDELHPASAPHTTAQRREAAPAAQGEGLAAGQLRDYARARGFPAYVFQGTLDDLKHEIDAGRPVIVGVHKPLSSDRVSAHYEVVIGYHERSRQVMTLDPARGLRRNDFAGFSREWDPAGRVTLVVFPSLDGSMDTPRASRE